MVTIAMESKYCNEDVELKLGVYGDGSLAMKGFSLYGEPMFKATVCVEGEVPSEGCVFLKGWSENEGIVECLVKAGIVELTKRVMPIGFCVAEEALLLIGVDEFGGV